VLDCLLNQAPPSCLSLCNLLVQPYVVKNNETPPSAKGYGFDEESPEGIPSLPEYLAHYCKQAAVPWPADTWTFYTALSLFRYGAICAGVYLRMLQGNASGGKRAEDTGKMALYFAATALKLIQQGSVLPASPPQSLSSELSMLTIVSFL
jgi:acyl-CoA dehydrogenase